MPDVPMDLAKALKERGASPDSDGGLRLSKDTLERMEADARRTMVQSAAPAAPRTPPQGAYGEAQKQGTRPGWTWTDLRQLRERSPVLTTVVTARLAQIRAYAHPWDGTPRGIGYEVTHKDATNRERKVPRGFERHIERAKNVLARPAPSYRLNTLADLLEPLADDLHTINHPVVEPLRDMYGEVCGWRYVDGGIIIPTLDYLQWWTGQHADAVQEMQGMDAVQRLARLEQHLSYDVVGTEYLIIREGMVDGVYHPGQLLSGMKHRRTAIRVGPFQPSTVEDCLDNVLLNDNALAYNGNYFSRGLVSAFMLGLSGSLDEEQIDKFLNDLRAAGRGVDRAWQPPILRLDPNSQIQRIELQNPPQDGAFMQLMSITMSLVCAVFRMHPSTINVKPWDGGGSRLSQENQAEQIADAEGEGLRNDLEHLRDVFLVPMVQAIHPDLTVALRWGDEDEGKKWQTYEVQGRICKTRNEIRVENDMAPMGFWLAAEKYDTASDEDKAKFDENPWNWPTDPGFASVQNQKALRAQMGQGQGQEGDNGFGQPATDDEDGFGGQAPSFPFGAMGGAGGPGGAKPPAKGKPPEAPEAAPLGKALTIYVERGE